MRRLLVPVVLLLVSCSGGSSSAQLPTTLPPTVCAADAPAGVPVVRLSVAVPTGGVGSMSMVTLGSVVAGTVRLVVEADRANPGAVDVAVTRGGVDVMVVRGVAAGDSCGVDVQLEAGEYTASSGGRSVTFTVVVA